MPASTKRSSQRKRREPQEEMSSTPADEETTPSRPSKRRRKLSESEAPDTDHLPAVDDDPVSRIIPYLKHHPVQASKDHSNAIHESRGDGVSAYAKVAAYNWTFYITKFPVKIGRSPEVTNPDAEASKKSEGGETEDDDEDRVHIDLGPGKTVSREHASISYDSAEGTWYLTVKGRNGVKVNNKPIKANETHALSSGEVLEAGNVEMMFVLPSEITPLHIDPSITERAMGPPHETRTPRQSSQIGSSRIGNGRPGTPPSSVPGRSALPSGKSPALSTPGAVMVGANGADLSLEENKHIKPQYSYAQMITQAIDSVPESKLTLNGIYTYITETYAYYRNQPQAGWQNSIRHNLSLNKHFEKVARTSYEPGKGAKWQIVPESREELVKNAYRIGRGGHRGSSAPSSPNQLNYITQGPREMASRGTPSSRPRHGSSLASPPHGSSLTVSQTPDIPTQRSRRTNAALATDGSPVPRSRKGSVPESAFSGFNPQSPPTLTSSYYQEEGVGSMHTPAPPKMHPRLAPASTAKRPSQHMPTSSPAPFWRYVDIQSTPLRPSGDAEAGADPFKAAPPTLTQDSSPIRGNKSPPSSPSRPQKEMPKPDPKLPIQGEKREDDGEEGDEEFDLAKGFQSINTFHSSAPGVARSGEDTKV